MLTEVEEISARYRVIAIVESNKEYEFFLVILFGSASFLVAVIACIMKARILPDFVILMFSTTLLSVLLMYVALLILGKLGIRIATYLRTRRPLDAFFDIFSVVFFEECLVFFLAWLFGFSPYSVAMLIAVWVGLHAFNRSAVIVGGAIRKTVNVFTPLFLVMPAYVKAVYMVRYGWLVFASSLLTHLLWDLAVACVKCAFYSRLVARLESNATETEFIEARTFEPHEVAIKTGKKLVAWVGRPHHFR